MTRIALVLFYLAIWQGSTVAFEINKDSVNFIDTTSFIYLINRSDTAITIDTATISKANKYTFRTGMFLLFDTLLNLRNYYGNAAYNYPMNDYYNNSLSHIAVGNANKKLKISGKDSLRISNVYIVSEVAGKIANTATSPQQDTLLIKFVSSDRTADSLIAIVRYPFLYGGIKYSCFVPKTKNTQGMKAAYYYLVNGKVISNRNQQNSKMTIIISAQ